MTIIFMPNALKNFDDSSNFMPLTIGYQPEHYHLFHFPQYHNE
jgi:hypothetical protein